MGLSAGSLRIAMLTARKSGLEFEGQQINQQRSTLANETSALFNKMLTMQVPTPPDPSEFTRMFYTFDSGGGLSQILNVARTASGAYTHDVTYKSPKTSSVLMKKSLNNVGFRYDSEKDQLSALIDGLQYGLEVNGDKDSFNEYLATKATYDNMKNIESAYEQLSTMSNDTVLTQSQILDYYEAIGLTSTQIPEYSTDDVQNFDDAFGNVYSERISQKQVTVGFYESTTLPEGVLPTSLGADTDYMLTLNKSNLGQIEMLDNDSTYKMTLNNDKNASFTISKNDSGFWMYRATNVSKDSLSSVAGVCYNYILKYTTGDSNDPNLKSQEVISSPNNEFSIPQYTNGNLIISPCTYDGEKWSYTASVTGASNVTFKKDGSEETITIGDTYNPEDGLGAYNVEGTYPNLKFTRTETQSDQIQNPQSIQKQYSLSYEDKSFEFTFGVLGQKNFTKQKDGSYLYDGSDKVVSGAKFNINDEGKLTVTYSSTLSNRAARALGIECNRESDGYYSIFIGPKLTNTKRLDTLPDEYYLHIGDKDFVGMQYIAVDKDSNIITEQDQLPTSDNGKWVHVQKDTDGNWYYEYQLTDQDYSDIISVSSKTYDNNTYTLNDGKYTRTDENGVVYTLNDDNTITYPRQVERTLEDFGIKAYYSDTNGEHELNTDGKYTVDNGNNPPPGLNMSGDDLGFFDRYNYGNANYYSNSSSYVDKINGVEITKNDDGTFNITKTLNTKDYLPNYIIPTEEADRQSTIDSNGITYTIQQELGDKYKIKAVFNAYSSSEEDYYTYDQSSHTLSHLIDDNEVNQLNKAAHCAEKLLDIVNGTGNSNEQTITVEDMLVFYEALLNQFKPYNSSAAYKRKLDSARSDYLSTIDIPGIENPDGNNVIFNYIDANGNKAYLYVPVDYANSNGQVDSTFAYMYETSYLEGQSETISQKANIIYDENGRIAKITFADGTVVIPEVTIEQDDAAYNEAMVKYDYQKEQYEKELADCNARTEIIAQQDKRLEIKLKSIDTQHSAIETELEALKKVLENNVKSSFGTFSA